MTLEDATMMHDLMSYVDTDTLEWEELEPGARRRVLHANADTGQKIVMVEWDPGYRLSKVDEHTYDEFLYILSGTFVDQHQSSGEGTYIHSEPGSSHQPSTPDGCTFLAIISPRTC